MSTAHVVAATTLRRSQERPHGRWISSGAGLLLALACSMTAHAHAPQALDENYRPTSDAEAALYRLRSMSPVEDGWEMRVDYVDGPLRLEATRSDPDPARGHWIGAYTAYHADGAVLETGRYDAHGRRTGEVQRFFASGDLQERRRFREGRLQGQQADFYKNGQMRRQADYKDGVIADGPMLFYDRQGRLSGRRPYRDGKRHGVAETYQQDGRLSRRVPYVHDVVHGTSERFYESGSPSRIVEFVDGERHGEYRLYAEGGQLVERAQYQRGKRHGVRSRYRVSGDLIEQGAYAMGMRVGTHRAWYRDGRPRSVDIYDDEGKQIDRRRFDSAGELSSRKSRVRTPHGPGWRQERWRGAQLRSRLDRNDARTWTLRMDFDEAGDLRARSERLDGEQQGEHRGVRWDGAVDVTHYRDGQRHGERWVRRDGVDLVRGRYRRGMKIGTWREEDVEGRVTETYDGHGRLHGARRIVSEAGVLRLRAHYARGVLHGHYERHEEDGVLLAQGHYRDGLEHGDWILRDSRAGLRRQGRFHQGHRIGRWHGYNDAGYLVRIWTFDTQGRRHGHQHVLADNGALLSSHLYASGERIGPACGHAMEMPDCPVDSSDQGDGS